MTLMVVDHARLKVVISYDVCHLSELVVEPLLARHHCGARGINALYDVVQHTAALHSLVSVEPCL